MSVLNHYIQNIKSYLLKKKNKREKIFSIITTLKFSIWLNNKIKIKQK